MGYDKHFSIAFTRIKCRAGMPRPGILHLFARCTPLRFAFTGIKLPENFNQTLIETYSLHVPSARQGQCHLHTCKISPTSLHMLARERPYP